MASGAKASHPAAGPSGLPASSPVAEARTGVRIPRSDDDDARSLKCASRLALPACDLALRQSQKIRVRAIERDSDEVLLVIAYAEGQIEKRLSCPSAENTGVCVTADANDLNFSD